MTYRPEKVLITGATSDFGIAFASAFDGIGSKLVLHGRSAEKLASLRARFPYAQYVQCDLADAAATHKAFAAIHDVDLLINNAGGAVGLEKFQDADLADLESMIDMNVLSLLRVTRHILPQMIAAKRGHVITLGSIAGNWPYPGGHVYCASKAFVQQFAMALRCDLVGTNIRVTNIEPGMVETSFSLKRFKGDEARANAVYANTRPLQADDIATIILHAATLPAHVNITTLEVMPTVQTTAPLQVERF